MKKRSLRFLLLSLLTCSLLLVGCKPANTNATELQTINNEYFKYNMKKGGSRVVDGVKENEIIITYACTLDLRYGLADFVGTDSHNAVLCEDTAVLTSSDANQIKTVSVWIDKEISEISVPYIVFNGSAYVNIGGSSDKNAYQVIFKQNNGSKDLVVGVEAYDYVSPPKSPQKDGYYFIGWSTDGSRFMRYGFNSKPITSDLKLYAFYQEDKLGLAAKAQKEALPATVEIVTEYVNTQGNFANYASQGSGVIFKRDDNYRYVLTNNHVAMLDSSYDYAIYLIYDYQGNMYGGGLLNNALDPKYDLACLYFRNWSSDDEITNTLNFAPANPNTGDAVSALGTPGGVPDTITTGKVEGIVSPPDLNEPESSDVQFPVIQHNSLIYSGSSGGPLVDENMFLTGLNYAGTKAQAGDYIPPEDFDSFAIPATNIKQFLTKYNIAFD